MGHIKRSCLQYTLRYPCGSTGKESARNAGDLGSIPRLGIFSGERKSYPTQFSGLENSMDCIVHRVAESDITEQLSLLLFSEVPEEAACWHLPPQGQPTFLGTEIRILAHQSAPSALWPRCLLWELGEYRTLTGPSDQTKIVRTHGSKPSSGPEKGINSSGKGKGSNFTKSDSDVKKAMAPHSSTLAWKIPWTEEPGRLQPMGSRRVGHDWATSLSLFTLTHWRRKWQLTPVFLPRESQGRRSLVGCCLWGCTESDTIEAT